MGEAFLVRRGGSSKLFAIISVSYPAGSVCTCTNGTKTIKARDTSGKALFNVPSTGTWTVTATDGTNTASKDVSITTEGQTANVELYYRLYLYNNGDQCTDVGGNWASNAHYPDGFSLSYGTDKVTLTAKAVSQWYMGDAFWYKKYDTTGFAKLVCEFESNTLLDPKYAMLAVSNNGTYSAAYPANCIASSKITVASGTVELDISGITGSYNLGIATYAAGTNSGSIVIRAVYLA